MGSTFLIQQPRVPNRDRYQSNVFDKGESLSLGTTNHKILPVGNHRETEAKKRYWLLAGLIGLLIVGTPSSLRLTSVIIFYDSIKVHPNGEGKSINPLYSCVHALLPIKSRIKKISAPPQKYDKNGT
jgi:hypothetical protein